MIPDEERPGLDIEIQLLMHELAGARLYLQLGDGVALRQSLDSVSTDAGYLAKKVESFS